MAAGPFLTSLVHLQTLQEQNAQVLGVYTKDLTGTVAEVLRILGVSRAMVVHGSGLDEITITGETDVTELGDGRITKYIISPEMFGFTRGVPRLIFSAMARKRMQASSARFLPGKKVLHAISCS